MAMSGAAKPEGFIMFARLARRLKDRRPFWAGIGAFRDRRVAGLMIAFFGR